MAVIFSTHASMPGIVYYPSIDYPVVGAFHSHRTDVPVSKPSIL